MTYKKTCLVTLLLSSGVLLFGAAQEESEQAELSITDLIKAGQANPVDNVLWLSYCNITTVSGLRSVNNFQALRELYLSCNQIVDLPPNAFDGLQVLQELSLSMNQIVDLPSNIFNGLQALRKLDLSNNQIKKLSPNLFNSLRALFVLDLSHSPVKKETIKELKGQYEDVVIIDVFIDEDCPVPDGHFIKG